MTVEVTVHEANGWTVIAAKGRLDGQTADAFLQEAQRAVGDGTGRYVLDLSEVPHVSSAGLRGVLVLAKAVRQGGGAYAVCIPEANTMVKDIFRMSGFESVIKVCGAVSDATGAAAP